MASFRHNTGAIAGWVGQVVVTGCGHVCHVITSVLEVGRHPNFLGRRF